MLVHSTCHSLAAIEFTVGVARPAMEDHIFFVLWQFGCQTSRRVIAFELTLTRSFVGLTILLVMLDSRDNLFLHYNVILRLYGGDVNAWVIHIWYFGSKSATFRLFRGHI